MNITNVHAADELAAIRSEIKALEAREAVLRTKLMAGTDADRDGNFFRAFIQNSIRESVDKVALIAALGRDVVEPFIKKTEIKTLKVAEKEKVVE